MKTSDGDLSKNFRHAAARITFGVARQRGGRSHPARGQRKTSAVVPPVGNLFDQFLSAAETEPVLAEWFLRRFSLLDSLYLVPSPRLVARTIRHNTRSWLAERRTENAVALKAAEPIRSRLRRGTVSSARRRSAGWDRRRRNPCRHALSRRSVELLG